MTGFSRRQFLAGLGTGIGLGCAGIVAWRLAVHEQEPVFPPTTLLSPSTAATASSTTTIAATTTPEPSTTITSTTTTTAPPPQTIPVICREAWGAAPISGELIEHEISHVTVHHTAVLLEDNSEAPGHIRQHQAYHQSLGWPDLAYHFIVDAAGNVYEGRAVSAVGDTATGYDPSGHLLICCEGNFDEQEVPTAQYDALVSMVAWGCTTYGIDPGSVRGHRDLASTSCPGDHIYERIATGRLEADVHSGAAVGIQLDAVCGDRGARLVASIEGT